jgi:hypothetical protein
MSSSTSIIVSKLKPVAIEGFLHFGHSSHLFSFSLKAPTAYTSYTPAFLATTFFFYAAIAVRPP